MSVGKNTKLRGAQRYAKAAESSGFGPIRRAQAQAKLNDSVKGGSALGNHRPDRVKGK